MFKRINVLKPEIEVIRRLDIDAVIKEATEGLPEQFKRFYGYVLKLRYYVLFCGCDFERAFSRLEGVPESAGELCTRLRI